MRGVVQRSPTIAPSAMIDIDPGSHQRIEHSKTIGSPIARLDDGPNQCAPADAVRAAQAFHGWPMGHEQIKTV